MLLIHLYESDARVAELATKAETNGARYWIEHVLANHVDTNGWPEKIDWDQLVKWLDRKNRSEGRIVRVSAPEAFKQAPRDTVRDERARLRQARHTDQPAKVEQRWWWEDDDTALIQIGNQKPYFRVDFHRTGNDEYTRSWSPAGPMKRMRSTGLFKPITTALKEITLDFIAKHQPASVYIQGADAKRNEYNSKHYEAWTPPGYEFVRHKSDERHDNFAASDGTIGVSFKKKT